MREVELPGMREYRHMSTAGGGRMIAALTTWWRHNVIADEPCPELSFLDRMDGLTPGEYVRGEIARAA